MKWANNFLYQKILLRFDTFLKQKNPCRVWHRILLFYFVLTNISDSAWRAHAQPYNVCISWQCILSSSFRAHLLTFVCMGVLLFKFCMGFSHSSALPFSAIPLLRFVFFMALVEAGWHDILVVPPAAYKVCCEGVWYLPLHHRIHLLEAKRDAVYHWRWSLKYQVLFACIMLLLY